MTEANDAPNWGRLYTAMVTPMTEAGGIDVEQAQHLASALLKSGSDGVVVSGTTGESPTLTHEEERVLFRELADVVHDAGGTLIAGTGSNSTATAVDASEQAAKLDVDGLLQVVPYYNKPSQDGLYHHFKAVADAVPETPIMLYNVPGRTGLNMSAQTVVRLAEDCSNIVGVKEASGDLEQIAEIIRTAPPGFRMWSGNDQDNLALLAMGGHGTVSVISHLVGGQLKAMYDAWERGDTAEAGRIHVKLAPLVKAMFLIGNPAPVKWALNDIGFNAGPLRAPLADPDEGIQATIRSALEVAGGQDLI
ncbi:MAG: 4-hydroxy-tetrahydrodipicolinate synthase [Chloroflexota bacterium]|nr:4-hydroxy-tetrahydrodipicolinate synthase [Chloroflexota bacterium]MDE2894643.1 4-hydroxy-tetrahydrodipicolinate synthase [Chloroflexota bacterium]